MSDIVERLRDLADVFEAQQAPGNLVLHMRAGADEIERKKAEISSLLNTLADERTESMKLRAALEELLACPAIADGNHNDPAWACHETAAAETFARKVLARAALEGK